MIAISFPVLPPSHTVRHAMGLALLASVWMAGCAGSEERNARIAVEWTVDPEPARVGPTLVQVALADSSGRPLEGADVVLEGTMTHPGMQPVLTAAQEASPGCYEARLELTMAGDWILILEATLADGTTIRRQREVPRVRPR